MSKLMRLVLVAALLLGGLATTAPMTTVALASPGCPSIVQPSGAGTSADPYRIMTPAHLMWLSSTRDAWDKEFLQVDDIDFDGCLQTHDTNAGWSPIGDASDAFTGTYDGQGHSITDLYIDRDGTPQVGFFGRTLGAEIRHLHLIDVDATGRNEVGALIGTNAAGAVSMVHDVSASGSVTSARTGEVAADAGGLFGYLLDITITYARSNVTVTATGRNVGGLIGDGAAGTTVSGSWATGNVTSAAGEQGQVGGLVGLFRGVRISDSYATGSVTRGGSTNPGAGGLVGRIDSPSTVIENSYATGSVTGTGCPTDCGFLLGVGPDVSSELRVALPAGATAAEIRTAAGSWDTGAVWTLPADPGLPTLRTPPGRPVITSLTRDGGDVTVTVESVVDNGLAVDAFEVTVGTPAEFADSGADLALPSSFAVGLDPDVAGPQLLRIRAASGDVKGPSVAFWRPSAPQGLTAGSIMSDSIDYSWSAPAESGTGSVTVPAIGYVLEFGTDGAFDPEPETTGTTASLSDLGSATDYSARITARNVIGLGATSAAVDATTILAAPSNLTAYPSNDSVVIHFDAPVAGGTNAITDFQYSTDSGANWTSAGITSSPLTLTGLTAETTYTVALRAVNGSGPGDFATVSATTSAADSRTVFFAGVSQERDISGIVLPVLDGQADAAEFRVIVSTDDPAARLRFDTPSSTFDAIDPATGYPNVASLISSEGAAEFAIEGRVDDIKTALGTLRFRSPSVRIALSVEAVPGGAAFDPDTGSYYEYVPTTVTWVEARCRAKFVNGTFDGSVSPSRYDSCTSTDGQALAPRTFNGLEGYLANITSKGENTFVTSRVGTASAWLGGSDQAVTRLSGSDTNIDFEEQEWRWVDGPEAGLVFWVNGCGTGDVTCDAAGVSTASGFTAFSSWNNGEPNDAGSGEGALQILSGGTGRWNDLPIASSTMGFVIEYRGLGTPSVAPASLSPVIIQRDVPRDVVVIVGDGEVPVSWVAPTVAPDESLTGYLVRSEPDGRTCTVAAGTTECTVTGLTNGTTYTFTVSALISGRDSRTSAASAAITPGVAPTGPPTDVSASVSGSSLTLTWSAPADPGGGPILGYDIEASDDGGETWRPVTRVTDDTSRTEQITTLFVGREHVLRVAARNGLRSAFSEPSDPVEPPLSFEHGTAERVVLGDLASRSQRKLFTVGGASAPFTVTGTDSRTGSPYSFLTDVPYGTGSAANRESDERNISSFTFTRSIVARGGRSGVLYLSSNGNCLATPNGGSGTNTKDGFQTFCSVFGPEAWTNPFNASVGEALTFDYQASASDNYEIYAFLVRVAPDGSGGYDYGTEESHTLILHRRGQRVSQWTTASGAVPATGTYRFRFVDGAYDQTGGRALGTDFYVDPNSVRTGRAQTISFPDPGDQIGADDGTFDVSATSSAGATVTLTSTTTDICTVSGLTVTKRDTGSCTLSANAPAVTVGGVEFVAPATVTRTFQILGAPTAPAALGPPGVFGTAETGTTLTADIGTWGTGGRPITTTTLQWFRRDGVVDTAIPFATGLSLCLFDDLVGERVFLRVSRTNSIGTTSGDSALSDVVTLGGTSCAPPAAPTLTTPPAPSIVAPPLPPGPVLTSGAPPRPSPTPTARVGDAEVPVSSTPAGTTRQQGTTTVSTATILEVSTVSLAVDVTGAGEVRTNAGAAPEVRVVRDAVARTSGSGLLPGTEVRAWLPLDGTNARQLVTLPVAEDGTFTGELPFDGSTDRRSDGRPLPIGTHVLQLVGVDATGEITVIEQTVRIEQPAPTPEPDRTAGAPPALTPGASIATNAGVPEAVTVVPVPDVRQARVEGSGWTMAVDIPSADGRVAPAEGGGALIELVEDDVAEVSGDGFLGGTRADVWLFSTPTLLGSVTIAADGTFSGEVDVTGIATGEHTLQLQGVGSDGYVRAANLGVVVVPRATEEPTAEPEPEPEPAPVPQPDEPEDRVEVVTAAGEDTGGSDLLLWIAVIVAAAGSGWWFLLGRRRRDDEDADELTADGTTG